MILLQLPSSPNLSVHSGELLKARFLGATVELCPSRLLLSPLPSNAHTTSKVINLGWGKEKKKERNNNLHLLSAYLTVC